MSTILDSFPARSTYSSGVIRGRVNRSVNELIDTLKYWKSCRSPDRLGALPWIVGRP